MLITSFVVLFIRLMYNECFMHLNLFSMILECYK